jgi:hypothetical protein
MNANLDQRHAELVEQAARGLAAELLPTLTIVDGYGRRPSEMKYVMTKKGPMAYIGVKVPKPTGLGASLLVLDHHLLMGIIPPGATPADWFDFPILLKRIAVLLGADPNGVSEMRTGSAGAKIVESAKGLVSPGNVHAGSGKVTGLDVGVGSSTEHQTITLRWQARESV